MKGIWLKCLLSVALFAYLVFALYWTSVEASGERCTGMDIVVLDSEDNRFVTTDEIVREIDNFPTRCKGMFLRDIDTDSIESRLNKIDKIESASCVIFNDGKIHVTIVPMHPVVRVFDNGNSYYLNREGKRIVADARYYLDVPVVSGCFDSKHNAIDLLPLIDYISSDSIWNSLISMIKVDEKHNILLFPMIRGHVINFGDIKDIENKFERIDCMYKEILPNKGWDFYDTLSVKWRGQIVATKRVKKLTNPNMVYADELEDELPKDIGTMLADSPGMQPATENKKKNTN